MSRKVVTMLTALGLAILLLVQMAPGGWTSPLTGEGAGPELTVVTEDAAGNPTNEYSVGDTVFIRAALTWGAPYPGVVVALQADLNGVNLPLPVQQEGGLTDENGQVTAVLNLVSNPQLGITFEPGGNYTIYAAGAELAASTTFAIVEQSNLSASPVASLVALRQNAAGENDQLVGAAGAVTSSSDVRVYADSGRANLLADPVAAGEDGQFTVNLGDTDYMAVYVTATESGREESSPVDVAAPSFTLTADRQEDISVSRPTVIRASTVSGQLVDWTLVIKRSTGATVAQSTYSDSSSLEFSWSPVMTVGSQTSNLPSGQYTATVTATESSGPGGPELGKSYVAKKLLLNVYTYPARITGVRILNSLLQSPGEGNAAFKPGELYNVEVTIENLESEKQLPMIAVQTFPHGGNIAVGKGTVKLPMAARTATEPSTVTAVFGMSAPLLSGTQPEDFDVKVIAQNDWSFVIGTGNYKVMAPTVTGNFTVEPAS